MLDPTTDSIHELRHATGDDPVLLTLAPERPGALDAIRRAVALGLRVSLGHTDASHAQLAEAVAAGATCFTHLGNGCPGELNRHDNIVWRVFETPGLIASVIPDKAHVSPALFRLIHRTLGAESVYYVTDAMAAAGALPGRFRLGRLELDVGADQIVRLPGKSNFAGSALRPIDGVFRAADMLGCSWQEVWPRFSETPARLMRLKVGIEVGSPADFCRLELSPDNRLQRLDTFIAGQAASED
jgi:N-acetylglucosamine-6-phosphate deacetylase